MRSATKWPAKSTSSRSCARSGIASSAALPLLIGDRVEGLLIFNSTERGTFTPELIELLQRLAENVSFAVGNFDRVDEKTRIEEQKEHLTRMFAALSATNEAIMRAKSRAESTCSSTAAPTVSGAVATTNRS